MTAANKVCKVTVLTEMDDISAYFYLSLLKYITAYQNIIKDLTEIDKTLQNVIKLYLYL